MSWHVFYFWYLTHPCPFFFLIYILFIRINPQFVNSTWLIPKYEKDQLPLRAAKAARPLPRLKKSDRSRRDISLRRISFKKQESLFYWNFSFALIHKRVTSLWRELSLPLSLPLCDGIFFPNPWSLFIRALVDQHFSFLVSLSDRAGSKLAPRRGLITTRHKGIIIRK